jgi:hypothetical protein
MDFTFEERPSDSPLVERIWRTQSERAGSFISRAASQLEMVVWRYQGETYFTLRGPEIKARPVDCPADAEFLGIQFKIGTYMPRLPTGQLMNGEVVLPEASSNCFRLHSALWEFPSFENADTFIERLVRAELLVQDQVVTAVLQNHPHDLSPRSVQYRFLRATGLTSKAIHQIERARKAAALLEQGMSIADTIDEAGYFDQPHLTRALKQLIGQTPAQLARSRRPA